MHQDFRRIAGLVARFVGDQCCLFLLDIARRRTLTAADPTGKLALVQALLVVANAGGDAIAAARVGGKFTTDRLHRRSDGAFLHINFFFAPLALAILPFQAHRLHSNLAVRKGVAIEIGDNRLDHQRLPLFDKGAVAADADIAVGWVDEQTGCRRPCLPVDIHHHAFGHDAVGARAGWFFTTGGWGNAIKVHTQVVNASRVGATGVALGVAAAAIGPAVSDIAHIIEAPPRRPLAKGKVRPARG